MNKLNEFISSKERKTFPFKPNIEFYNLVGIKRKRWAKLMRKEVSPTLTELENIAKYFEVSVTEIIN